MAVTLQFVTLDGRQFELALDMQDKVLKASSSVCDYLRLEYGVRLIHRGTVLDDKNKLSDYLTENISSHIVVAYIKTKQRQIYIEEINNTPPPSQTNIVPISAHNNHEMIIETQQTKDIQLNTKLYTRPQLSAYACSVPLSVPHFQSSRCLATNADDDLFDEDFEEYDDQCDMDGMYQETMMDDIQNLLSIVRRNPHMIDELIDDMSFNCPELMQKIKNDPDNLENILADYHILNVADICMEEDEEYDDYYDPPTMESMSCEEMDSVERLKLLGFTEELALQAYLACERNESDAASFLLSLSEEDIEKE